MRCVIAALVGVVLVAYPSAQGTVATPRFEVASVKPNRSGEAGGGIRSFTKRFEAVNVPASMLVMHAYNLRAYQLLGGPGWLQRDKFDVRASVASGASTGDVRQMLRMMLAERFRLSIHNEMRNVRGYALLRREGGKLGAGLKPPCQSDCPKTFAGFNWSAGVMEERRVSISAVAAALTDVMHSPVTDRTGIVEQFDVMLRWSVDAADADAPGAPSVAFRRAVEEQLGLKLEDSREVVQVVVIDRIERPTPD